jgi:hypothetical protein
VCGLTSCAMTACFRLQEFRDQTDVDMCTFQHCHVGSFGRHVSKQKSGLGNSMREAVESLQQGCCRRPNRVQCCPSNRYQAKRPDLQKVLHPMLPPGRAIFMRRMKNKITAKEKRARDKAARRAARKERKAEQVALKRDRKAQVRAADDGADAQIW